jgi:UDP:flavonoid glycosyltransferase YjiC (YdhE family)
MQALLNQKPMLVMPHGRDQHDNAARVAERGAGLVLDAGASTADIKAALQTLLNDPDFTDAARKLGAAVAAEAAHSPVIEELEALAATPLVERVPQVRCA